ncbi:MAG: YgiQ family radical SAM protein [Thermoplasmata archaeon]|nr:YgiQ family radical SAM protein [Thermoplasmata archaeon]
MNSRKLPQPEYLPVSLDEARKCYGSEELDVILITGDAYIDQPSFGIAIIGRVLVAHGYRVGIIPQPDWHCDEDFRNLGKPRLFFGVTAGSTDSMVSNYSPSRRKRKEDDYSPDGIAGRRPDRATIVYSHAIRKVWREVPIVLGGIEASLRRFAHYDYWDDKVRQSVLADAHADWLVYGMGELQAVEIARRLEGSEKITEIPGIVWKASEMPDEAIELPSFDDVCESKEKYADAFLTILKNNYPNARQLAQRQSKIWVVQNPPMRPLSQKELDWVYSLPFTRNKHPSYGKHPITAEKTAKFSIVTHRGCFGGCAFCALAFHQGNSVVSRSEESILAEAGLLASHKEFRGTIMDVGGPSANMYGMGCKLGEKARRCERSCLYPAICPNLDVTHERLIHLLKKLRNLPAVKHVFVQSGIRFDLAMTSREYLEEVCKYHISGQLKIAPEHIEAAVTDVMRKPDGRKFEEFLSTFEEINRKIEKDLHIVPYFMAAHPGCELKHMLSLAKFIKKLGFFIEQVQEFTPTPGTLSTCIYYTGFDPYTGRNVHVPKGEERAVQRALLQLANRRNFKLVKRYFERHRRNLLKDLKELMESQVGLP